MSIKQYVTENYGRSTLQFLGACLLLWVLFLRLVSVPLSNGAWLSSIHIVTAFAVFFAAFGATVGAIVCFIHWMESEPDQ